MTAATAERDYKRWLEVVSIGERLNECYCYSTCDQDVCHYVEVVKSTDSSELPPPRTREEFGQRRILKKIRENDEYHEGAQQQQQQRQRQQQQSVIVCRCYKSRIDELNLPPSILMQFELLRQVSVEEAQLRRIEKLKDKQKSSLAQSRKRLSSFVPENYETREEHMNRHRKRNAERKAVKRTPYNVFDSM